MGNTENKGEKNGVLGLDLGSRIVKFLEADALAGRVIIRSADSFTLQPGQVQSGVVKDPKRFGSLLARHLKEAGVRATTVNYSIPSRLAVLRWVKLPLLFDEELRLAVRHKVQRHLPFPVSSAYVEACAPLVLEDGKTAEYLVIAVKRDIIDSRAEAIESAGLYPLRAEVEAQSVLRVVDEHLKEKSPLWRDASLTIIDLGGTSTHMYVVQNQRLQFLRGVSFGSFHIAQAVANSAEIDPELAEQIVSHPDTELTPEGILHLQHEGQSLRVNVVQELDKLIREFLRLLRYFRSLHPERSYAGILDHVLLCGGLVGLKGFAEYLQSQLNLRVERLRPFAGAVGNFNRESFHSVVTHQEAYTVVMGLALAGLKRQEWKTGRHTLHDEFIWVRSA
jgi:type IV pilus assembly protein PilM